jgi:1,4-alpha-glucan branching enzyme
VCVVGDFNSWTLHADPLVDKHGDGQWSLFFPLRPGRYEYKFVIDGTRWISDPRNPATVPDGFDGVNSLVVVPQPSASP